MTDMTLVEFLRARLDEDDRVTIETLVDLHDDHMPDWLINEVDDILNPWCFRTVPEVWSGLSLRTGDTCRCAAMAGRDHGRGPDCPPAATP